MLKKEKEKKCNVRRVFIIYKITTAFVIKFECLEAKFHKTLNTLYIFNTTEYSCCIFQGIYCILYSILYYIFTNI